VSKRSASKWTVPVASTWMVDIPRGIDMHGGSLPPPPPAGAGGSAIPAPKMFEVPGTSTVTADPHDSIRAGAALVLAGEVVAGATRSPPAAVQPAVSRHTIPRAARGRRISGQPPGPRMLISGWRTAVKLWRCVSVRSVGRHRSVTQAPPEPLVSLTVVVSLAARWLRVLDRRILRLIEPRGFFLRVLRAEDLAAFPNRRISDAGGRVWECAAHRRRGRFARLRPRSRSNDQRSPATHRSRLRT
jgi:hypothetical protein